MSIKETVRRPSESARRRFRSGFTLLELLLVLTLAPVVFFAVYSNFSMGVRLWQRLQTQTPDEDTALFVLKAQKDFSDAMRYSPVPFSGDKEEVSFMADIGEVPEGAPERAMGQVRYRYDAASRSLVRLVRDFSEVYRDADGHPTTALPGAVSAEFSYLTFSKLSDSYSWDASFRPEEPGDLPVAVRVTWQGAGSAEKNENTFFIPAGGTVK